MIKNNKKILARTIHFALFSGVFSTGLSANVIADQITDGSESNHKSALTGTRIKSNLTQVAQFNPITVIEREEILRSGKTDVGDYLQSLPMMSGSPIGTTTNNQNRFDDAYHGSVRVDLRGLGSDRTLVLVNGRRVVDGGDFQAIPLTMIDRIEILKEGASAVYGADAVAGVVNIITRSHFTGFEVSAQASEWSDTNGAEQNAISLIAGQQMDRGRFVFGAEYVDQKEAFQRDVPWDFMQHSYYIDSAGCENQLTAPHDGTPQGGCYPVGSSRIPESRLPFYTQGLFLIGTPATAANEVGLMIPHDGRTYNYAPVHYLQTPYERTNVFAEGEFNLTDSLVFNAEIRANQRYSAQQIAPLPFTGGHPMYQGLYVDPATGFSQAFTGISQDNYYLRRAVDAYNAANGTSLIYEPVVNPRRRMIETDRRSEQKVTQYQWTIGLAGELGDDMTWDVFYNEGHSSRVDQGFGQLSASRLFNAMGPSADLDGDGRPECYADINNPATLIVGCVPLNFFGGGAVDAGGNPTVTSLTQEMIDYVALDTVDSIVQEQTTAGLNLSGAGIELSGGELAWSVGWNYRQQELTQIRDSAKSIGAVTGNIAVNTQGKVTTAAYYGEINAPIFDNLNLKGGLRYDDAEPYGSNTTYQLGAQYQVYERFNISASYARVFRAPNMYELFEGFTEFFPAVLDPCTPYWNSPLPPGCAQQMPQYDSQILALVGGNSKLTPETGDTLNIGMSWWPELFDQNLNLTADFWQINLNHTIESSGAQFILDQCYYELNQQACALVMRRNDYAIGQVLDVPLNSFKESAKGLDLIVDWTYPLSFGQLKTSVLWTHFSERNFQMTQEPDSQNFVGILGADNEHIFAEDKVAISLLLANDNWSVAYNGEYISSLKGETQLVPNYAHTIPSQFYSDLVGSYTFDLADSDLKLSAGVTNLTNEAPPFIDFGFHAKTDPSTYRVLGRGYFLRAKWAF